MPLLCRVTGALIHCSFTSSISAEAGCRQFHLICILLQVSQRHAAVLVPLFIDEAGVVQVLLTQRAASLSTHAGACCGPHDYALPL